MNTAPVTHSIAAVSALGQQIAADALKNNPHALVLDALLTAFATVAYNHPCCTLQVGQMAILIGQQLIALSTEKPANATTH